MQWTFLGTSSMVPTKERNVSGYFLQFKGEGMLFDCGEGTQRQMNLTGLKRTAITKILISHWHGDHISGLCGLLHTLNNEANGKRIDLFGPQGTQMRMEALLKAIDLPHPDWLHIHELTPEGVEIAHETEEYTILTAPMVHSTPCVAYSFEEKERFNLIKEKLKEYNIKDGPHLKELKAGKDIIYEGKEIRADDVLTQIPGRKITLITDTITNDMCMHIAEESDILICESTYDSSLEEKAHEHMHMTCVEAAQIASQANVKKLFLTHFSQRYKDVSPLEEEARAVFDNTFAASDLQKVML